MRILLLDTKTDNSAQLFEVLALLPLQGYSSMDNPEMRGKSGKETRGKEIGVSGCPISSNLISTRDACCSPGSGKREEAESTGGEGAGRAIFQVPGQPTVP